jgi:predicted dehydrogenase
VPCLPSRGRAASPSTHARLSLQAIEAGKHVLVEKPLATTTVRPSWSSTQPSRSALVLMAGHTFEHNAAVHKLRDLIRGHLGRLYYFDCARLNLGLYRPEVGVIMDLAPHDISVANFVLSSRPSAVTAWGSRHVHPEYAYVAHLLRDYGDLGVRASIQVSWLSPQKARRSRPWARRRWPSRTRTSSTASPTAPGHRPTATAALTFFRYSNASRYRCASSGRSS